VTLRFLGHPLHSVLTHFPIALLITGAACDGAAWAWPEIEPVARFLLLVGLLSALPAALVGLVDWAALGSDARVQRVASRHIVFVALALVPFVASLWCRGHVAAPLALALDALGSALLGVGGWHGGELVFGHGIGTRRGEENGSARG
jgi:uncharacterized membrane protein